MLLQGILQSYIKILYNDCTIYLFIYVLFITTICGKSSASCFYIKSV